MRPVQVTGEVLSTRKVGAYTAMTVAAPGIAENVRPGHFVAFSVGGVGSGMVLRRAFSVYQARPMIGSGGSVEVVFAVAGAGTAWLAQRRVGDKVDLVGPLGRPFRLPRDPVTAVLVGGGYGAAPLFSLAAVLRERGCRVDLVLGAATEQRLFGILEAKRAATSVVFTTDDGSYGIRGRVTDVLEGFLDRADVVYTCGPMAMLRAVAEAAAAVGVPSQVAVEESMACGVGVCMTCVLPVIGDDGRTRMLRSCVEGPVFAGESVRFADIGTVPPDAVGAPPAAPKPAMPQAARPAVEEVS
jgi:dihydroorotate dehydrogenase electron transfer subunit